MKCNVKNRTIFCHDNLEVLQGLNSECIDLIYLDPPFNKQKTFTAPIGSSAEGAEFKDIFKEEDLKNDWLESIKEDHDHVHTFLSGIKDYGKKYNFCYLAYMAVRLVECQRVLKATGSIYLHCDPTMSHYLKILLDCIFGENNFRNEIIWAYTGPGSPNMRQFNRKHDIIFWYSKGATWIFNSNKIRLPYKDPNQRPRKAFDTGGHFEKEAILQMQERGKVPETWWVDIAIVVRSKTENTGYPTQKPLALLERIVKASSNAGDTILDPFCGCATTCVASEKLGREWIGIDVSHKAYDLVRSRLDKEVKSEKYEKQDKTIATHLFDSQKDIHFFPKPPKRTDIDNNGREQKYVYIISNQEYPNEYKVGIAKNCESRLNSYQIGDPDRAYKLEFKYLTPNFRAIEKHIHSRFPNKHEWVQAEIMDIKKEIRSLMI